MQLRRPALALSCFLCAGFLPNLHAGSLHFKPDTTASKVTFAVHATVDSFTGNVTAWDLDLTVPEGGNVPDHVVFRAALAALATGKKARDREMLEWMNSDHHPQLVFTLKSIKPAAGGGHEATGELALHGITMPLTIPITIGRAGSNLTVRGEVVVDHRNFGLKPIRKFAVLSVSPEVRVAFILQGTLE